MGNVPGPKAPQDEKLKEDDREDAEAQFRGWQLEQAILPPEMR
jgi:hypothetical protein